MWPERFRRTHSLNNLGNQFVFDQDADWCGSLWLSAIHARAPSSIATLDEFGYAIYGGATPFSDGTGTSEIFEFDVLGLDIQD